MRLKYRGIGKSIGLIFTVRDGQFLVISSSVLILVQDFLPERFMQGNNTIPLKSMDEESVQLEIIEFFFNKGIPNTFVKLLENNNLNTN